MIYQGFVMGRGGASGVSGKYCPLVLAAYDAYNV